MYLLELLAYDGEAPCIMRLRKAALLYRKSEAICPFQQLRRAPLVPAFESRDAPAS